MERTAASKVVATHSRSAAYGEDALGRAHEHHAVRQRRGRHQQLAHRVGRDVPELAARSHDQHLAVFARQIDLAVGGDRRRAVTAADVRAGAAGTSRCRSSDRRRRTRRCWRARTATRRTPAASACRSRARSGSTRPRRCSLAPSFSVRSPRAPGLTAKIGRSGRAAARDDEQAVAEDRRWRGDLRAASEPPQLLAPSAGRSRE